MVPDKLINVGKFKSGTCLTLKLTAQILSVKLTFQIPLIILSISLSTLVSCSPGAGFHGPCESHPTQDIL